MNEEEKTQEIQKPDEGKTEETSTSSLYEKTEKVLEKEKEQLDRREALISREEELHARKQIGGHSEAGVVPKKKTEDEKWTEEAKERYAGTGLDPTDDNSETTYG